MRVIPIAKEGGLQKAAQAMLTNALMDPDHSKLVAEMIEDPEVDRGGLFGTAFAFGATFAMAEAKAGRLVHSTVATLLARIDELERRAPVTIAEYAEGMRNIELPLRKRIVELEECLRFTRDVGFNATKINQVLGEDG